MTAWIGLTGCTSDNNVGSYNSPGHGSVLQDASASKSYPQSLPPYKGNGLSHLRDLFLIPPPHELLHLDQAHHCPHPPSTEIR